MKDEESILQFSFKAENDEKFSAKRFFNLSRMIFRLPQIEKSFAADRGSGLKMVYNKCLFSSLKGYGAQGMDLGLWRPHFTADRFPPASYGRRRLSSPIS